MERTLRNIGLIALELFSESATMEIDHPLSRYQSDKINNLIEQVRQILAPGSEQIGVWESAELNIAEEALRAGFTKVALIAAANAMAVFQLEQEEYNYGYKHISMKGRIASAPEGGPKEDFQMARISPNVLLQEEKRNARDLFLFQEEMAQELKAAQLQDALYLKQEQAYEAQCLREEYQQEADSQAGISNEEIKAFSIIETKRNIYQQELEEIITWSMGGYSISCPATTTDAQCTCDKLQTERTAAMVKLRQHQEETAAKLLEEQMQAASHLLAAQELTAARLKEQHRLAAVELVERQVVRALRRKIAAEKIQQVSVAD